MSQDFWEDEDIMSEDEAQAALDSADEEEENQQEADLDLLEDSEDNFEEDLKILKNARLRLEQGKLYEMLLKHNLFDGVDADERAVNNVQREIRSFIKERLEILVGLRPDPRIRAAQSQSGLNSFSDVELQVLKEFVGRVAKPKPQESRPAPVKSAPANQGLKPMAAANPNVKVNPTKPKAQPKAQPKPKKEPEQGLTKPPSQMTLQELKEYNKKVAARQASRKAAPPQKKIPMPDANQITTMYANRVQTDPGQNLVGAIMAKLGKSVTMVENVGDGGGDDSTNDSRI